MKVTPLYLVCLILFFGSCSSSKSLPADDVNEEKEEIMQNQTALLVSYMTGSFNSADQEAKDSSYYNISLHMYPIWENSKDGYQYLYVEQAMNRMQDKPYRQRVYQIAYLGNGFYESAVYTLANQEKYIGKYKTPSFFESIGPSDLEIRDGCAVILEQHGDMFRGSTLEDRCKSSLRGASYATSKVKIYQDRIESWDQGFDQNGNQVWGAVKGGYIFKKIKTNE
jgi:CpeT protein